MRKGIWNGRRTALLRPPDPYAPPRCAAFLLCGGCGLQEHPLAAQRAIKRDWAQGDLGSLEHVRVHPVRGDAAAYGYRNKVELSFGSARFLTEDDHLAKHPIDGRWLGFHAPGRWDRVANVQRCELVSEPANAVIGAVRALALAEDAPPPWGQREQRGFWRHLVIRQGFATGQILVVLVTTSPTPEQERAVPALAEHLLGLTLTEGARVVGVVWRTNDGVAEVATGDDRQVFGQPWIEERLNGITFRLSASSFFQTSTRGAEILYDTIGEALGDSGGVLFDLYCGTGTIGQVLAERFDRVIGVEECEPAVLDARENAQRNGVSAEYRVAKVEDALDALGQVSGRRTLVVDPPRVGVHPKVAQALARADADVLIYVACHPASLGRDRVTLEAGGWVMTDVWTVDLFPQTGHMEVVARFERR